MLLNQSRARELLVRENAAGLIAHNPINQYYLSDYWGIFNRPVGYEGAYFSLFAKDEQAPAALIIPALEIRRLETLNKKTSDGTWVPNVFSYSGPMDENQLLPDDTPKGQDYLGWLPGQDATLEPLEQRWLNITEQLGDKMSPNAFWAVLRAIKAAGLEGQTVIVDDVRIENWLASIGFDDINCVYNPQLFNEIRMVKTTDELLLIREAARINERAMLCAADAIYGGATWAEIESVYLSEMAKQGGQGVYLLCGLGELPAGEIRLNEPVMIDALGQYQRYHGDFGRCVVLGEPSERHQKLHSILCLGWEVAQQWLKPGVRYSELSEAVGHAVRSAGFKNFRNPIVHGLGLEHTDDPKPFGVQPQTKMDQVLQTNMVVNVDMPHTEIGWGSLHVEDTVVITDSGFELLSEADLSIRKVGV